MGRIVKWLLIAITSVLTLLIIAVVAVIALVDPNDYRDEIERAVAAQTGRELVMEGDLKLAFFPWIGLQVNKIELADAPDFGPAPFLQADHAQLALKVLPLLQGNLVLDTIMLDRPRVHLIRNEQGRSNWQTFTRPSHEPKRPPEQPPVGLEPDTQPQAQPLPSLLQAASLAGLRIRDGRVTWDDRQSGQYVVIASLNTTVEDIRLGAPITIESDWQGRIKGSLDIGGKFTGTVMADSQLQHVDARDLDLALNIAGDGIPGGKQQLRLRAQAAADLEQASYRLTDLRLDAAGVQITGQLSAQQNKDAIAATGRLQVLEFNPRKMLRQFGMILPDTRDPDVLKQASAQAELGYRGGGLTIEPLSVRLDDSVLTGRAKLRSLTEPAADFDLALDHIDVDRYRPPPHEAKQAAATPAETAAAGAAQLPIETLRHLDLNGRLRIGTLKVNGATISDADLTVYAKDGQLRVHPLTAALYGGTYRGDMQLDATGETPRIELNEQLSGIQAGPLLTDVASFQKLIGTTDFNLRATTRGAAPEDWLQALTGLAHFTFRDGAVKGINIAQAIREALARAQGKPPPAREGPLQTDFSELGGTLNLAGGVVRNTDFSAKSPLLRIQGQGVANLLKQSVDYRLTAKIVGTLKGQGGQDLEQLRGMPIPLRFTGKLSDPSLSVDLAGLFKERFEQKRQGLEEKGREKLEQKLNQQLERLFNR
ncbi:MAG: AsmA family protein [Nitrococcus mobilis]|nr:AsmA family protein [Nitrococcus mobilis]